MVKYCVGYIFASKAQTKEWCHNMKAVNYNKSRCLTRKCLKYYNGVMPVMPRKVFHDVI